MPEGYFDKSIFKLFSNVINSSILTPLFPIKLKVTIWLFVFWNLTFTNPFVGFGEVKKEPILEAFAEKLYISLVSTHSS